MPIYKDDAGCLVLEFGQGDIGVSLGTRRMDLPPDQIMFTPGQPGVIGRADNRDIGKLSSETGVVLRMAFPRRAGLIVVIEEMQRLLAEIPEFTPHGHEATHATRVPVGPAEAQQAEASKGLLAQVCDAPAE